MGRNLLTFLVVALLFGLTGNAWAQSTAGLDEDPNLVGWWKFDAVSDNTVADASKKGHDGTLQGGLSAEANLVEGRFAKALQFDGKDGMVEITGFKGVAGTKPRTVAAWIKSKSTRGELVAWGTDDFGQMWLLTFIRSRVGVTPSGGYLYVNDMLNDEKWHHVAAVVEEGDPPNLHDSVKLYVDGVLAKIHDIGLLDLWPVDTGAEIDVRIGRRFNGAIDDVRIYDRALSEEEIKTLFGKK